MIRHRHKILERHNFFPAILLWITVAGKAWIAFHWVTEKKSNMALTKQWRSFWQAQKRGKQSFLQSSSKGKRGFTPKLRVEVRCPRGLGTTTIFPKSQPQWRGDRKPEWSAQTESSTVTKGAIHSTKIPTGKSGPPQKMDQFFGNFSGWAEPIHWVLERNSGNFGRIDRTLKYPQVNLQAHLEAMHALTSDTAEQGTTPVLQHQHECYQSL